MLVKEPDLMTAEHLQDVALVRTLSERRGAASSGVTPDRRIVQEIPTPEKEPEWMTNAAAAAFDVLPIDISVQLGNDKDDSDDEDPYAAKAAAEKVKGKDGIGDDDQHAAKTAAGKAEGTEYNKFVGTLLRDPLFMHGQSAKNRFSGAVGAWKASHPSASKQKPQAAAPKKIAGRDSCECALQANIRLQQMPNQRRRLQGLQPDEKTSVAPTNCSG